MKITRIKKIENILDKWTWNEENKTYVSLTAFKNQINIMNFFRRHYKNKGDLSNKQIKVAEKIIKQNENKNT